MQEEKSSVPFKSDPPYAAFYKADQQRRPRIKPLRSRHGSQALLNGQTGFPIRPGLTSIA